MQAAARGQAHGAVHGQEEQAGLRAMLTSALTRLLRQGLTELHSCRPAQPEESGL